jgi:hypothetical protein
MTETKIKDKGGSDSAKPTPDKIPSSGAIKRLKEMGDIFRQSSNTDRLIAAFTGLLVFVAIAQGILLYMQINTMRKDQRPWIKVSQKQPGITIAAGQPLSATLELVNIGKTPARSVLAVVFVEIVDNNGSPRLIYFDVPWKEARHFSRASTGVLFTDQTLDAQTSRQGPKSGGSADEAQDVPLSPDELKKMDDGRAYVAVYTLVVYKDTFDRDHWTTFCGWKGTRSGSYTAAECTNYNNVDNN